MAKKSGGKGSSKPSKVGVSRITAKQRVARIRNMAIARKSRKKGGGHPKKNPFPKFKGKAAVFAAQVKAGNI